MRRVISAAFVLAFSAPAFAALPAPDKDDGAIKLPPGFRALVVADDLGPLRFMTVAANGDVYVKMRTVGIIALPRRGRRRTRRDPRGLRHGRRHRHRAARRLALHLDDTARSPATR